MLKVYSPTDVSRLTGLSYSVVRRCMDQGLLKYFTLPNSSHRKITEENLQSFQDTIKLPDKIQPGTVIREGGLITLEKNGVSQSFVITEINNDRIVIQDVDDKICEGQHGSLELVQK